MILSHNSTSSYQHFSVAIYARVYEYSKWRIWMGSRHGSM
jgi:hypothetical protein